MEWNGDFLLSKLQRGAKELEESITPNPLTKHVGYRAKTQRSAHAALGLHKRDTVWIVG